MSLWEEIESQPQVLAAAMETLSLPAQETADWIRSINPAVVTIAARGSSDNAARYAQYVWGARNGINVSLATPSLFGAYEAPPRLDDTIVVGISQSGASPDLLNVLLEARSQSRPTLAITNEPESPMAEVADRTVDLGAGAEAAVAATKTYTSQLLAIALISAALDPDPTESLELVPEQAAEILASPAPSWIEGLASHNRCLVIGRGFHHATAHEWSLKIAELAYLVAQPFSAADFRHGPMALIEHGLLTCLVSTSGPMAEQMRVLATDIATKGGTIVAISDDPALASDHRISIPPIAEWVAPITAIIAAQVFTYHLTRARGIDPDRPRSIQKVTRTS